MALDARHKWVLRKVAELMCLDQQLVHDAIVKSPKAVATMTDFFREGGPRRMFVFHQPPQSVDEFGNTVSRSNAEPQFSVTAATPTEALHGQCAYFVRIAEKGVQANKVEDDVLCGFLESNVARQLEQLLASYVVRAVTESWTWALTLMATALQVVIPALSMQESWGELDVQRARAEFLDQTQRFTSTLGDTLVWVQDNVQLARPEKRFLLASQAPSDVQAASENQELVDAYESVVFQWCKTLERTLAESELIRKESDDAGPKTELEYWKARMGKFNSITDQLKSRDMKLILNVLRAAKAKILRRWKELDGRVSDAANEAKDNVKYLYTIVKNCEPLYKGDPPAVLEVLPSLLSAIKIMHSIARFYNTNERMTTLFTKITNQMIINCRRYLHERGSLWDQNRAQLVARLELCIQLNAEYQSQYRQIKNDPHGKPFDFSEVSIFGKFDMFARRAQRLIDMFRTIEQFSSLNRATMDNLEPLTRRFQEIMAEMRKKPYDITNYRVAEFDNDYAVFEQSIRQLEEQYVAFINATFADVNTDRGLRLLKLLDALIVRDSIQPVLHEKATQVFRTYCEELQRIANVYETCRNSPPLPRNATPVAGNITWARQLVRRLEVPMRWFRNYPHILQDADNKPVIRQYNRVLRALVSFEMTWHQGWCNAVNEAKEGLLATLLVRHPQTKRVFVNFDHNVIQLFRETKAIQRLGLEVPPAALAVAIKEEKMKQHADVLEDLVRRYYRTIGDIPAHYGAMFEPSVRRITALLEPGLTTLAWTSLNIDSYVQRVDDAIGKLQELVTKCNDIYNFRILQSVYLTQTTPLVDLPAQSALVSLDDFAERQETVADELIPQVELRNQGVQNAVADLLALLQQAYTPEEYESIHAVTEWFVATVNSRFFKALLGCFRLSLNLLKRRFTATPQKPAAASGSAATSAAPAPAPAPAASAATAGASASVSASASSDSAIFRVELEIDKSGIVQRPSLDSIQRTVNAVGRYLLQNCKQVFVWVQEHENVEPSQRESFFDQIASNKEIVKAVLQLTGAFTGLRRSCQQFASLYAPFEHLWKLDKQDELRAFLASRPSLDAYDTCMDRYSAVIAEVDGMQASQQFGCVLVDATTLKELLKREAREWKQMYGAQLAQNTRESMQKLVEFITSTEKQLARADSHKSLDLETVNSTMQVLERLREMESEIHMRLAPIEETHALLRKYDVRVDVDEQDQIETVSARWEQLRRLATRAMDVLQAVAPDMKTRLLRDIEEFRREVKEFKVQYDQRGPMVAGVEPRVASERVAHFNEAFEAKRKRWEMYSLGERLFGVPQTEYPELEHVQKELKLLDRLYDLYNDVMNTISSYDDILWADVDIDKMTAEVTDFQNRQKKMPKVLRTWDAFQELSKTIDDFANTLPLLQMLKAESVLPRHWDKVGELVGQALDYASAEFKVKNLLDVNLSRFQEEVEDVCVAAAKEMDISLKFDKLRADWAGQELQFSSFKKRGDLILSSGAMSDLLVLLEESQATLGSLLGNRYNAPFRKDLQQWMQQLTTVQERVEQWMTVQALWIYLEAVFSGGDIAAQLPQEAKRFQNIDKTWERIMASARDTKNIVQFVYTEELLKNLLSPLQESLEICQKSLAGYLEAKRGLFPRFFFVSDAQLLEILGQGSNPHTIQPHLSSIFDAIHRVEFDKVQRNKILAMYSPQGERVDFSQPVWAENNIEDWLNKLKAEMASTIKTICRTMSTDVLAALATAEREPLEAFMARYPAQVTLLGLQLWWTFESTDALTRAKTDRHAMANAKKKFDAILRHLVDLTTTDLKKVERVSVETLITVHIHQVDIHADLIKKRVKNQTEFEWLKQTRFYWRVDQDECIVSVTNCDLGYCYEYTGVAERLVITPLTDRIYISCAQAMAMFFGGAPAGPAGTGKTETTKDMGKTCGRYFITINCSDQMDYRAMGKMYKGIAQSGVWCGFDEINRVDLPVLSVVAAQIACLFSALKAGRPTFTFTDGSELRLDKNAGVFITMNPGYAGRTELPENMKALFRTIAVVVPDRQIIMRVRLAASGFQEATQLAKKFFVLYRLCEEQLSKQNHYDFGLRNILSVLRTAGTTKRANQTQKEVVILMRVLRDMNVSKLVDEDEPLFLSLIQDLFPGITVDKEDHSELQAAIQAVTEEEGIINTPDWNLKVIQLYEQYRVRHGLCVMGPSGSGKSAQINTLAKALSRVGDQIRQVRMNPKAITATQMFGRLDVATNDWTDGIFSALWRQGCRTKPGRVTWIELDGPVDAVWIENLNTVLDDTRTLTLANGDRIIMPPELKLMFEVGTLNNASPATVSRLGMVYMGASALGWRPIVEAWLRKRTASGESSTLHSLFERFVDPMFAFLRDNCTEVMEDGNACRVAALLRMLSGLLPTTDEPGKPLSSEHLTRLFVFALIWSLGSCLEREDRSRVHYFLLQMKADVPAVPGVAAVSQQSQSQSQAQQQQQQQQQQRDEAMLDETVYEYVVGATGRWEHWRNRVREYVYPQDSTPAFSSILVPTLDSTRTLYLIDVIAKQFLPVLLIGESGTAKTVTIQQYLASQNPESVRSRLISFSSASTPMIFQRNIESSVEKRLGTLYGPPAGKQMIVFVDDVNMPDINEWGDQVTNEILRQTIGQGGFYSLEAKRPGEFMQIKDVSFIAAMNQPGGGRNDIPSRLKRLFNIFNVTLPSQSSMADIYGVFARGHFSAQRGFVGEVTQTAGQLPLATLRLWQATKRKMLPTPAKFHYIFNLRDLSRIFQGMLCCTSEVIVNRALLLQLWRHECMRVLPDKFTTSEDVAWFERTMEDVVREVLGDDAVRAVSHERFFVDFMRLPEEPEDADAVVEVPKVYEPIESMAALRERVQDCIRVYNESVRGAKMDLVLFDYALMHLMRINRIIRTPRGNALLVGVGGSGKQSLTRLASHIAGYKTFQLTITRTYNVGNLLEDLKALYRMAAVVSPVTFLFTDNEVKEESFLEYINMILSSGEIAGLFPKDELDSLLDELRAPAKKADPGFIDTTENLYEFFINRVRDNLHVVLCFSPVGEKFRTRARRFPGLVNGCTIDWFPSWPQDALLDTARSFLQSFDMKADERVREQLLQHMTRVHVDIGAVTADYFARYRRHVYVTPKTYLSFVNSFKELYARKHTYVKELADRIKKGLTKLLDAAAGVSKMKIELQKKEKDLAVAQRKVAELIHEIAERKGKAEIVKNEVQKVKDECLAVASKIEADKSDAERDLEAAQPAIDRALAALNMIKPADIATIKKLAKPPPLVKRIMDGVIILRHQPLLPAKIDPDFLPDRQLLTPSWATAQQMMGDMSFLRLLQEFARDNINDETCELLEPYLAEADFNSVAAAKSSGNIAGLCTWIGAMVEYHEIYKMVEPKKARLREAESRLRVAQRELGMAEAELAEKQAELDALQARFDEAMREKQALEDDANLTKRRLEAAEALIGGLSGEQTRWTQQSQEFDDEITRLVGDCVLAAAFLSYAGPFNQDFRSALLNEHWATDLVTRKVPMTRRVEVVKFLATESQIDTWTLEGLPRDELSIQNGIMVTTSTRFALMIDPQGQGKSWIRSREKDNSIMLTNLNHKLFRQHLEDALGNGFPLLIEDVGEELDPVLDPVLDRNVIGTGRRKRVRLGDKEVDFDPRFRMYITTKLANPHFSPETSAKCSIIDFTVTMRGLEDQLLARVIGKEKADLEESRQALLKEIAKCKKTAVECEERLLEKLSSVEGNLLDDASVIDVLNETKAVARRVRESLDGAQETEAKITVAREEFRPAAHRGSVMYFVITELSMVKHVYQCSLVQFLRLFDAGIERSKPDPIVHKRVHSIIEFVTFLVFKYIQRGLYEADKPMYQLMMTLKIDLNLGKITPQEMNTLLKAGGALDINSVRRKPYSWVPDNAWLNINALAQEVPMFGSIVDLVCSNEAAWRRWFDHEAPESQPLPDGFEERCNRFQRLLLVRCWREDRMLVAAQQYIIGSIGQQYVESIPLELEELHAESDRRTPIGCMLSMGSDPTSSIQDLAKKLKVDLRMVSMGQGQEPMARKLIADAMQTGGWVMLQNCHLSLAYLTELEAVFADMVEADVDPGFRLWYTTDPYDTFPINFLQLSLKFTNEPPQGLKAGMRRCYAWVSQDMLEKVDSGFWPQLLYATCFLHSTLIERRRFGPLGWCVPYEFNHTDLVASSLFLENYLYNLDAKAKLSWNTIRYMICEVQYGGRITDEYDKRLLVTYGATWLDNHLFAPGFQFYNNYAVPAGRLVTEFRHSIEALPLVDTPLIFGLHTNAELTFAATQGNQILSTIMSVQPKSSAGGSGETREDVVLRVAAELLAKLPPDYNAIKVKAAIEAQGGQMPLNVCLRQEIDRMQRVLTLVRNTLKGLQLAIAGTVIMSQELQETLDALFDARVPPRWLRVSWLSPTLGYWFADVIGRCAQYSGWLQNGRPSSFWLTGFFNPQGFLTATKQESTRAHRQQGWSLDAVSLQTEVLRIQREDITEGPREGVYLYGMFLEGASWDVRKGKLVDSAPKVLFFNMPVIHVTAVAAQQAMDASRIYVCPVYRHPRRTDLNYVFDVLLRTDEPPEKWILRGVALLTTRV